VLHCVVLCPAVLSRAVVWCVQGSLPLLVAAVILNPAPGVMYLFFAARVGENALNHSGLDSKVVDLLTLKVGHTSQLLVHRVCVAYGQ
jgi:hypothetical protein